VAKFGWLVTNVVDGVEKNIPEPLSSLILGLSEICNFSGLWNGFSFGVPKAELQMTKSPAAAKTPRTPAIITSPDTKKAAATPGKENAGPDANTATSPAAKMTPEEVEAKIKARAERFGGFQSDDAKKLARAAKFGITPAGGAAAAGSNKLGSAPAVDMDTLKKRAERFGGSTSNTLKKMEVDEAIKRRQERFGVVDKNEPKPKKISLNAGANSVVMDEKMKARQQRFGLA